MSGHTPGPWSENLSRLSDGSLPVAHIVDDAGRGVAQLLHHGENETCANARPIAAAPMLLEGAQDTVVALKLLRRGMEKRAPETLDVIDAHIDELEFAISRATPSEGGDR